MTPPFGSKPNLRRGVFYPVPPESTSTGYAGTVSARVEAADTTFPFFS
jgi:hypothetical protein